MSAKVIKKAKELAAAIENSEEYQKLQQARENIEEHHSAKIMLRDFGKLQEKLRRKQLMGQPITDEEKAKLQKMSEIVSYNPYIRSLLEAEMAFAELMAKVQDTISELFTPEQPEEGQEDQEEQAQDGAQAARSKLWIPGQD